MSLNNKTNRRKRGVGKGFHEKAFHVEMSRGYSTITPSTIKESSKLSPFGPFEKDSKLCQFLGTSSATYWMGRTVVMPFHLINCIAWYLELIPPEVKEHFKSVEHVFTALPSYVGSFATLRNFCKFRKGYQGFIDPKLLKIEDQIHRLKLPSNLDPPTREDIFNAKITRETHPGIITRTQTYLKNKFLVKNSLKIKKENIIKRAVRDVWNNWNNIGKGIFKNTSGTYMLGSREKIHVLDLFESLSLRTVWIPETIDILVASTWFEHIKAYWGANKLFKSEIWLGHADQHLRFYRRLELDIKFKFSYDFDGKEWETGAVSELVVFAFNILRSMFKEGKFTTNHFYFIMDTLVNKKLILHNGNTWWCINGIPSGHAWTSLINSIVNWIIWTSTIKFCPFIPEGIRDDYELQIQGDDVKIDTNVLIPDESIEKIIEWMLKNFNYRAKFTKKNAIKEKDGSGLTNSAFLKRVTNKFGLIDTPIIDIWEKILCGPDYSKCRNDRMVYLRRRLNDLAVFNHKSKLQLALYYSFVINFPKVSHTVLKDIYRMLFVLTNGFTIKNINRWEVFFKITKVSIKDFIYYRDFYYKYFTDLYTKNFLTYDDKLEYQDYWKERPRSINVSDVIRNSRELPLDYVKDSFKVLHKTKKKKKRHYKKDKIMKGIKKLIAL
jgi:hypothetical protein